MLRQGLPEPGSHPNADLVREYANEKNGQKFATVPVAVFFDRDFTELYRYIEYPAIYHKDRVLAAPTHGAAGRERGADEGARRSRHRDPARVAVLRRVGPRRRSPEIVSALHERLRDGVSRALPRPVGQPPDLEAVRPAALIVAWTEQRHQAGRDRDRHRLVERRIAA